MRVFRRRAAAARSIRAEARARASAVGGESVRRRRRVVVVVVVVAPAKAVGVRVRSRAEPALAQHGDGARAPGRVRGARLRGVGAHGARAASVVGFAELRRGAAPGAGRGAVHGDEVGAPAELGRVLGLDGVLDALLAPRLGLAPLPVPEEAAPAPQRARHAPLVVLELGVHVDHGLGRALAAVVRLLHEVGPRARGAILALRAHGRRADLRHRDRLLFPRAADPRAVDPGVFPKGQSRANSENRPESRSRRRPVRTRSGTRVARNASVGSRVARRHEGGRREASRARRRVGRAGQCFLPFTQRISSRREDRREKTVSVFSNVRRNFRRKRRPVKRRRSLGGIVDLWVKRPFRPFVPLVSSPFGFAISRTRPRESVDRGEGAETLDATRRAFSIVFSEARRAARPHSHARSASSHDTRHAREARSALVPFRGAHVPDRRAPGSRRRLRRGRRRVRAPREPAGDSRGGQPRDGAAAGGGGEDVDGGAHTRALPHDRRERRIARRGPRPGPDGA